MSDISDTVIQNPRLFRAVQEHEVARHKAILAWDGKPHDDAFVGVDWADRFAALFRRQYIIHEAELERVARPYLEQPGYRPQIPEEIIRPVLGEYGAPARKAA